MHAWLGEQTPHAERLAGASIGSDSGLRGLLLHERELLPSVSAWRAGSTARRVCGLASVRLGPDGMQDRSRVVRAIYLPTRIQSAKSPHVPPARKRASRHARRTPASRALGPAEPAEQRVEQRQQGDQGERARRARAARPAARRPRWRRLGGGGGARRLGRGRHGRRASSPAGTGVTSGSSGVTSPAPGLRLVAAAQPPPSGGSGVTVPSAVVARVRRWAWAPGSEWSSAPGWTSGSASGWASAPRRRSRRPSSCSIAGLERRAQVGRLDVGLGRQLVERLLQRPLRVVARLDDAVVAVVAIDLLDRLGALRPVVVLRPCGDRRRRGARGGRRPPVRRVRTPLHSTMRAA